MHFNLADIWERVTDTVPDHDAVVDGACRFTFAQLDDRADRLAHVLAAEGIGPGDHVALYLQNGVEYLEGMLAAFKIRAVPVNVNYRYVEEELRYLFNDADAKAVIFHRAFAPQLTALRPPVPPPLFARCGRPEGGVMLHAQETGNHDDYQRESTEEHLPAGCGPAPALCRGRVSSRGIK